jgi:molecular chaperone HscA
MALLQIHEPNETPPPHAREIAIGIDLGTTNSVVAFVREASPIALEDGEHQSIIPSAVYYVNGESHVGRAAFAAAASAGAYPLQSIKRLMGKNAVEAAEHFPYLEALSPNHPDMPTFLLDGREHTPITISADILRHLRNIAEVALATRITKAVITVPAYFDDAARQATRQAAQLAGLEVLRLINEPTAAAMAYGLEHGSEGVYAIYDLGGGTFDLSILNLERGVFQVLATAGDTALGGHDIDTTIVAYLAERDGLRTDHESLLAVARAMKEALSTDDSVTLEVADIMVTLSDSELESIAAPFIARTLTLCQTALEDANVDASVLHGVVMVGGSTRLRAVQRAVATFFNCPIYNDLDPDRVVAYGAAIQAHALTHGSDHLLLDVTPLSLGLETMGGIIEKIIHRNSPIPCSAEQEFTTYQDGQTGLQIHVVQGERELVDQCRSLARFELTGIPPMPAGVARIAIRFVVDADGLLVVSAKETLTGIVQTIEVKPSYGMQIEQIAQMIRESMEHGKEDMLARLLIEAQVEARRTLEELHSALAMDSALLSPDALEQIEAAMRVLEQALEGSDRDALNAAHESLKSATAEFAEVRMNHAIHQALAGNRVADM